ncbi:uncharacterized protein LOC126773554 isoform X3 [Nymphalis io]|uniref:uncharacterized protein LOC126773554 isoform X3 n=1 Tax=Inachis io TaxID=171585 RepID=UPI00216A1A52|nr:uncharacterized protein LOC126773554 isoform X3 [Nymphalis io]
MMSMKKQTMHHPWERTIKHVYNDYKHCHNTVNNPNYSTKKVCTPDKNRVKITIIGNRVVKEFISCVHLVKTLHKYRPKNFDAPSIREITTVEWPKVWNDLKLQYGGLAYCLENQVAVILNDKFLGGDKELKEIIHSRYHCHFHLDYYKEGINNFANFIRSSGRPCAYMHILIDNEYAGTLIFMLYADIVPYTSENFLRLCRDKKGGYSGTPVHRIVKDGWIQCGGFGLKNTELDCENFIIPHDRRGVLCMANDGRHVDCSTQFFVLLQPASWMAHKYVAFGQLIDGESTLKAIESVPTFYESPKYNIRIQKAGILNLECQDIKINKNTNEYLQGHIEDLVALGDLLYEDLMKRVLLDIELKRIALEEMENGEAEEINVGEHITRNIRATERFIRKKEDLEQLQKSQIHNSRASSAISEAHANNDFDVEIYNYEPEELSYKHVSLAETVSSVVKPMKPFYLPLTDVPYPGEVDSTYDLKKFLRGDYCLESDLQNNPPIKNIGNNISYISEIYKFDEDSEISSMESICSEDEQEIRRYLKLNVDRVSFGGGVIKSIARGIGKYNIFEDTRKSELITDEELRRFRKVSISLPSNKAYKEPIKIKRRQTGFVRPEDLERIYLIHKAASHDVVDSEDEGSMTGSRKVRIVESAIGTQTGSKRKQTGAARLSDLTESDVDVRRKSALTRLYDNLTFDNGAGPTLKEYKPTDRGSNKKFILIQSPMTRMKNGDSTKNNHFRTSITIDDSSFEQVLKFQHDRRTARKISSDYVKTIDQIEHRGESSIRSVEFAKTRPSLTVSQYQRKNIKHQQETENAALSKKKSFLRNSGSKHSLHGLRLPGDTPLYSMTEVRVCNCIK